MDNWWNKKKTSEKLEKKIWDLNLNSNQMVNSKLFVYADLEMVDPAINVDPLTLHALGIHDDVVKLLEAIGLKNYTWKPIREYERLTLEFMGSFRVFNHDHFGIPNHTTFCFRGKVFLTSKKILQNIFGWHGTPTQPEGFTDSDYDAEKFWKSITGQDK